MRRVWDVRYPPLASRLLLLRLPRRLLLLPVALLLLVALPAPRLALATAALLLALGTLLEQLQQKLGHVAANSVPSATAALLLLRALLLGLLL